MGMAISRMLLSRERETERQAVITNGLAIALAVMAINRNERWHHRKFPVVVITSSGDVCP